MVHTYITGVNTYISDAYIHNRDAVTYGVQRDLNYRNRDTYKCGTYIHTTVMHTYTTGT